MARNDENHHILNTIQQKNGSTCPIAVLLDYHFNNELTKEKCTFIWRWREEDMISFLNSLFLAPIHAHKHQTSKRPWLCP